MRFRPASMPQRTLLQAPLPPAGRSCPHCGGALSTRMTAAEQLDAINRYIGGETLASLAVSFNREVSTIRRLMARNGIRKNKPKES